jgi:hypothetical protein
MSFSQHSATCLRLEAYARGMGLDVGIHKYGHPYGVYQITAVDGQLVFRGEILGSSGAEAKKSLEIMAASKPPEDWDWDNPPPRLPSLRSREPKTAAQAPDQSP